MAKAGNGTTVKILVGVFVLVLVGYNSWLGINVVNIREHCARMDTKLEILMPPTDGRN